MLQSKLSQLPKVMLSQLPKVMLSQLPKVMLSQLPKVMLSQLPKVMLSQLQNYVHHIQEEHLLLHTKRTGKGIPQHPSQLELKRYDHL